MTDSVLKRSLRSHPAAAAPAGLILWVHRLPADDPARPLRLRYVVAGDPTAVRWPAALDRGAPSRQDGLWQHTCFEAFIAAPPGDGGYFEYNFSPSGAWSAYRFDGHRQGMRPEPVARAPRIVLTPAATTTSLEVAFAWPDAWSTASATAAASWPPPGQGPHGVRVGLSAVIEAVDGSHSYWALGHPAARPDFHNAQGFLLELEVPG